MEGQNEETEVSSTSETSSSAYSPHTQGFPPTSHSQPSNPFSTARKGWNTEVKTTPSVTITPAVSTSFLRPSKLEAGLGNNIFAPKHPTPTDLEVKQDGLTDGKGTSNVNAIVSNKVVAGNTAVVEISRTPTATAEQDSGKDPDSSEVEGAKETTTKEASTNSISTGNDANTSVTKVSDNETSSLPTISTNSSEEPRKETLSFNTSSYNAPVGFVFGSNLNDRVENVSKGVANGDGHDKVDEKKAGGSPDGGKRKWDATCTVTTGEEDESNVMQTSCRLFAFDVENSNWIERGRGQLRLNDRQEGEILHSRLIVRTKGSLRLMLNTPVFPQMVIERSSEKCVKITGHEEGGGSSVKLFLIQCSPSDAETLHSALEWRLRSILAQPSVAETQSEDLTPACGTGGACSTKEVSKAPKHESDSTSPPKKPKLSP